MERNTQKNGLINLLALLAAGAAALIVASVANSLAGRVASVFLGLGVLASFVSWFQMRLEERERIEKLELDELARSKASSTLFESKESEIFPAQRARAQFEKFFVPGFTILLLALEITGAILIWRSLGTITYTGILADKMLVAAGLFGGLTLILFILGRFAVTISRLEDNRLLRPSSNFVLLGAYLSLLCIIAAVGPKMEFDRADLYIAKGFCVVLGLLALETLATLVFEIYRPRVKGKVTRPLYDSRLVGLLAQPEGLVATAAQTLDYQFGFKVSETWFYTAFKKSLLWVVALQIIVLLLSTCVVFIEPGEQALLERSGKPVVGREVLGPGGHFKMPWPWDRVYRHRTEEIQTLNVGFTPAEEHGETVMLWTKAHSKEENFLVANRATVSTTAGEDTDSRKAPPVSLVTVSIPVQFQITDIKDWFYNHESGSNLLQQIATREVVRFLASVDLDEMMTHTRLESSAALRERIQTAADGYKLGAKILHVGLEDLHPPVKVAADYEKRVGAIQQARARVLAAQADAIRTNAMAGAVAFATINAAEAERLRLEQNELSRAAAFTNQLPAYNAAPAVYLQRLYARSFTRATAGAQKYVLLTTNTANVISFDLQRNAGQEYINQLGSAITQPKK